MLMANTIQSVKAPTYIFDLKGSTVGRMVKKEAKQTLKDCNFLKIKKEYNNIQETIINFVQDHIRDIKLLISQDAELLKKCGFIDYSILLAIEQTDDTVIKPTNETALSCVDRHKFQSKCNKYIYHVSLIDYLTYYGFLKKTEHFVKVNCMLQNKDKLSCVNPNLYSSRFVNFMKKEVFIDEYEKIVLKKECVEN